MSLSVSGTERRVAARRSFALERVQPEHVVVAVLTLGVFVLRLSQLHQSLFGDEVWTYQDIVGRSLGAVVRNVHTGAENSPPLFFILAWAAAKLGDPTVWIRVPSLILGTATIPLVYLLGRETLGRWAGVIGAAVMAFSPFSLYYGIEARPYASMVFFVTLSTFALVRAARRGSLTWWAVYVLAACAATYSHYTAVFVLAVQAVWALWRCAGRRRDPLIANVLIALLYLPWLSHVRGKSLEVIGVLQPLTAHSVLTDVPRPLFGYPYASLQAIPGTLGLLVIALALFAGALAVTGRVLPRHLIEPRSTDAGDRAERWLIVALAVATPLGLLAYSLIGTDLWIARGLYASAPAQALCAGALLAATRPPLRLVLVAAVLLTLLVGSVRAIGATYARPPFRAIAAYLDRVATPGQALVMYPSYVDQAVQAQFHKAHLVLASTDSAWRRARAGGTAYAIVDDQTAQRYAIGTPHPAGFRLVARRHYTGLVWLSLLTYRAQ